MILLCHLFGLLKSSPINKKKVSSLTKFYSALSASITAKKIFFLAPVLSLGYLKSTRSLTC